MIIKFRIISSEKEHFVRDIEIYDDSSFLELHEAIQLACDYDPTILTSFYISNEHWDKKEEIVLQKMDEEEQKDSLLMEDTPLKRFFNHKGQRLIYIYDFFSVRLFLIEVVNVRKEDKEDAVLEFPICTLCSGIPPQQIKVDEISEMRYEDEITDDFDDLDNIDPDEFDGIENYDL